jgi:uncharacterized protein (TIRG00374 family)
VKIPRYVQWIAGIVLAAFGMWIFFKNVNMHELLHQIKTSNPLVLVACGLLSIFTIWIRAVRASILLPSCTKGQRKNLFPIISIAFMINNILPARMGEAARAMLMWKKNGYSGAVSIGSLVLERLIDTLVFLSCFFIPVFCIPELSATNVSAPAAVSAKSITLYGIAIIFSLVYIGSVLFLFTYSRFPKFIKNCGKKAGHFIPKKLAAKISNIAAELMSNLNWTFSLKKVLGVVTLSYSVVVCYAAITMLLVWQKDFTVFKGLFAQAFAALGAAIPLAPGYVGTMHAVFFQGLTFLGLEKEKAGVVTIFYHAVPYLFVTVLGLFYFFRQHVSFKDISNAQKTMQDEEKKEGQS